MPAHDAPLRSQSTGATSEAPDSNPDYTTAKAQSIKNTNVSGRAGTWRDLFLFSTRADVPLLVLATTSAVVASAAQPAEAYIIGKVFDGFVRYTAGQTSADDLLSEEQRWVLWLMCIAFGSWLFHSLALMLWMLFGERQAERARRTIYKMLSDSDISYYDMQEHGVGALLSSLEKQIRELQLAVSQPLGGFIATISTALISLGQAFYNSWSLTLVTLATTPLVIGVLCYFSIGMQSALDSQHEELVGAQKSSWDALSAIDTVKCCNAEEFEIGKYISKIREAAGYFYRVSDKIAMQMGCLVFLVQAMFVQSFYYGDVLITRKEKTAAEVVTTFFSAITAFQAAQGVLPQLIVLEKGRNAAGSLAELLRQARMDDIPQQYTELKHPNTGSGEIVLENVSFSYPAQATHLALDNVSARFSAGRTAFIIGKSGSGKSTIGQLLVRFYEPQRGRILVDGQNIASYHLKALRDNICLVEQTSVLFNDTVKGNLQMDRDTTPDALREALNFALLQSVVSDLPDGLDTMVGHGGTALSGGQCQRIALARARIRDPSILILDECTSALDQISRDLIMAAIREWRKDRTTIIITHELSQLQSDDYVMLIQHGHIVQEGHYDDLISLAGGPLSTFASTSNHSERLSAQHIRQGGRQSLTQIVPDPSPPATERRSRIYQPYSVRASALLPRRQGTAYFLGMPFTLASLIDSAQSSWHLDTLYLQERRENLPDMQKHRYESTACTGDHIPRNAESGRLDQFIKVSATLAASYRAQHAPRVHSEKIRSDDESLHPGPISMRHRSLVSILGEIWPALSFRSKVWLLMGCWGGTVHGVSSPIFAYVLSKLLGLYAVPSEHSNQALTYSLVILALAATDGFHFYLCRFMLERTAQVWVDTLRAQALRRLLYQPKEFYDRPENAVFAISQDLDRSGEEMRNLLGRFAGLLYVASIIVVSSVIWAMTAHWRMTLLALATAPYIAAVTYAYSKISERMEASSDEAARQVGLCLEGVFCNIRTVRALTLEGRFQKSFDVLLAMVAKAGVKRALVTGALYGLSDSSSAFGIAFVFYIGARLVRDGESVASVLQVFIVLVFAITNVVAILDYIPQIGIAKVTAARVLGLANIQGPSHETDGDVMISGISSVDFSDLTFSYKTRAQTPALQNVNITIEAGQSVAIVGGSGSGKSTIAKVLLKLYATPTVKVSSSRNTPALRISGRAINDVSTTSLRSNIAVVMQSNPIFPTTVAGNISYGLARACPLAQHENIVRAARQAGILDFITSLPQSFDTSIGDGGMGLSGGQAQRIAIARALARHPSALILDEATSALDVESAAVIRATIRQLIKDKDAGMMVIIITHSKEMMQIAEQIVVLDKGQVVETGVYQELISRPGPLFNLISSGVWQPGGSDSD